MHLLCPDLDFKRLSCRSHQRRMKRLVHICLWHSDIVLESSRNRSIHLMDHSQCGITVLHRVHDDPHSEQIIHLIQRLILVHHLLINTEEMLHSSINLGLDRCILHML